MRHTAAIILIGFLLCFGTAYASDLEDVAKSLVGNCVGSSEFKTYLHNNKKPVVIVNSFENRTNEDIDTSSITKEFELALKNSKKMRVVSNIQTRNILRLEREQQQIWASEETAKRLANETGADLMLLGSIQYDTSSGMYQVHAELVDIESTETIWMDNAEIKLEITSRPAHSIRPTHNSSPAGRTTTTRPAPSRPDFDGQHVISLGYTFPTDLAKDKSFSAGSKDNFAISVSWEDSDHKQFPGILALSYRRRQVQEEGSSRQTGSTYYRTNQEWVQETRTLTHHTLMLEGSLGWKLIPHVLCYAGAGVGLSYIPENKEHGSEPIAKNVPWQVQVGTRVSLLNLLYIRVQTAYLHTGEFLPSLHLGLSLF